MTWRKSNNSVVWFRSSDPGSATLFNTVRDKLEDDTLMLVLPVIEKRYGLFSIYQPYTSFACTCHCPCRHHLLTSIPIVTSNSRVDPTQLEEDRTLAPPSNFGPGSRTDSSSSVASAFMLPSEACFLPNRLYSVISCRNVGGFELVLLHSPWHSTGDCWTGEKYPEKNSMEY